MEARHEIVQFDSNSPIKVFMHKLGDVSRHWHESMELLFVLAGEVTVQTDEDTCALQAEDVLLVNSNTPHELHSEDCVMIAVQIKLSKFQLPPKFQQDIYFDCNSALHPNAEKFLRLKQMIASLLQANAIQDDATLFYNRSLAYAILSELVANFRSAAPHKRLNPQKQLDRITGILEYLQSHYQEGLTLTDVADHVHLSAPYLSSFFEKHMGVSFSAYYTNLRLDHAVQELLYTDHSIEVISENCGFTDSRSFVRAFKKTYQMVPSAYRQSAAHAQTNPASNPLLSINYLNFKPDNFLHLLIHYLPQGMNLPSPNREEVGSLTIGEIDAAAAGRKLDHTWRELVCVGRARDLLYAEIQDMLRRVQKEIGFRFIRFHGIFSDDMLVCCREADGRLQFSFTMIDKALDFIRSIGLRPMIQFSFMPAALAKDPDRKVFADAFIVSPPARIAEWNRLLRAFLEHIRSRYGAEEIRSWRYSVWNEPDTSPEMFGFEDIGCFYELYDNSFRTVKAFDPALVFGSPSFFPVSANSFQWLRDFLRHAEESRTLPEYLDVHYYSDDFSSIDVENAQFLYSIPMSSDPEHFSSFLYSVQNFRKQEGRGDVPLYITEWNLTVSHRNLINDTCFKACYLAKNFLENYDRFEALGYWLLSDMHEELQPREELFHGGMGLFTQNGIPKSPYYAMCMLKKLGDTLVASGEGYFITRQAGAYQMLLYNYEHLDPLFAAEGFGLSLTERDGVFPKRRPLDLSVTLTGLEESDYRLRETILNQKSGSSFDVWVRMGGREPDAEETEWLRRNSEPELKSGTVTVRNGTLPYNAILAPHEVRLVEIIPGQYYGSGR